MPHMTQRISDANGWYEVKRNPISKAGVFPYLGRSIRAPDGTMLADNPDQMYNVFRPPEELASPEALDSFRLLPWTNDHPDKLLGNDSPNLRPAEEKGVHGVIGENIEFDPSDNTLYANIKLWSQSQAAAVEAGKRELSAGLRCVYVREDGVYNGTPFQFRQRMLRGNHISSVPEGRMGSSVSVMDSLTFSFDSKDIDMADPVDTPEGTDKEPTLDEIIDFVKKYGPKIAEAQAAIAAMNKPAETEVKVDAPIVDGDPAATPTPPVAPVVDADPTAPAKPDPAPAAAMDALERTVKSLQDQVNGGQRAMLKELSTRNALYQSVSQHVGAFDASEMTTHDVAVYAANKLGLSVTPGTEAIAVDMFLKGRQSASPATYSFDAKPGAAAKLSALKAHYDAKGA